MSAFLVGYDLRDDPDPGDARSQERSATGPDGAVHLRRSGRSSVADPAGPPMAALLRAAGPHVEAVLDIGTAPNGDPVLVLPRLPWALGDLLAARRLSPGEVVTVLIPLIQTLGRLHAAGVAHGAVGPGSVRFDAAGTPTLTGFDDAVVSQGPRDKQFSGAVAADERALAVLADALMRDSGVVPLALAADRTTAVRQLFGWAEPEAILLADRTSDVRQPPGETPGRVIPPADDPSDPPAEAPSRSRPAAGAAPRRSVELLRRMIDPLRRVRRRVWWTAGTALLLLMAAIALLPGRGAEAVDLPVRVSIAPRFTPGTPPSVRATRVSVTTEPKQAATRLVALRVACLAADDARCLRPFEASGSPVALLDEAALVAGVEAVRVPPATAVLRAASGTTATVAFDRATVLIVRQGDDWLLRDVVLPAD